MHQYALLMHIIARGEVDGAAGPMAWRCSRSRKSKKIGDLLGDEMWRVRVFSNIE